MGLLLTLQTRGHPKRGHGPHFQKGSGDHSPLIVGHKVFFWGGVLPFLLRAAYIQKKKGHHPKRGLGPHFQKGSWTMETSEGEEWRLLGTWLVPVCFLFLLGSLFLI